MNEPGSRATRRAVTLALLSMLSPSCADPPSAGSSPPASMPAAEGSGANVQQDVSPAADEVGPGEDSDDASANLAELDGGAPDGLAEASLDAGALSDADAQTAKDASERLEVGPAGDGGPEAEALQTGYADDDMQWLWTVDAGEQGRYSPLALGFDDHVYAIRSDLNPDNLNAVIAPGLSPAAASHLVKLDTQGNIVAEREITALSYPTRPLIRPDGVIVVSYKTHMPEGPACGPSKLVAYTTALEELWVYDDSSPLQRHPAVRSDNVVVIRVGARTVAIGPDGTPVWTVKTDFLEDCNDLDATLPNPAMPLIGAEDEAYLSVVLAEASGAPRPWGGADLVKVSRDGQVSWKTHLVGGILSGGGRVGQDHSVLMNGAGTLIVPGFALYYLTASTGDVLAGPISLNLHGHEGVTGPGDLIAGAATGSGTIFYTMSGQPAYLKTKHGEAPGIRTTKDQLLVGSPKPNLYVIDLQALELKAEKELPHALPLSGAVLTDSGLLVSGSSFHTRMLHAYQTSFGGLATTGFPKLYADNQNSLRVRGLLDTP